MDQRDLVQLSANVQVNDVISGKYTRIRYPGVWNFKFNAISGLFNRIFSALDVPFWSEPTLVIIRELFTNASKANAKRIYFQEHGLDIANSEQYESNMVGFTNVLMNDFEQFAAAHVNSDYYIDLILEKKDNTFFITVENNAVANEAERKRIQSRYNYFKYLKDMGRVFTDLRDEMEGSGLGLVMSLMLLKRSGIPAENFRFAIGNEVTQVQIAFPLSSHVSAVANELRDNILSRISALPMLPERISSILALFDSPSASLTKIAAEIETDPGLTAQILRMVYSAGYINRFKSPNIADAVKIIGLNVIYNLLLVTGARNVLASRFQSKELETIWEHSNRVSFITRKLCEGNRLLEDSAPVVGLLHELGRIILISMEPHLVKQIDTLLGGNRIRQSSLIEEIELGISHPEIGALLLEKWNFPENIVTAIRFQQKPLQAPEKYKSMIATVYMAICLQEASLHYIDYYSVEPEILNQFQIPDEEIFLKKVEYFTREYDASAGNETLKST